jgi:PAS domain S-box-containing protein
MENFRQPKVAVEELERPLRAIFNQTFEFVALMEPDGILIEINQTALDFAGLKNSDVIDLPLWEASWWQSSKASKAKIREAIATAASGKFVANQVDILGADNTLATLDFTVRPIKNRSQQIILLVLKGRDLTHRQIASAPNTDIAEIFPDKFAGLAQKALWESEQRFQIMAHTAPVMIWMSGLDKLCNFLNQGWLEFTGRTMAEELGNGWIEGIHPDDIERCLDTYTTAFEQRQKFRMEYRLRRFDGEYRWVLDTGTPRFTSDGAFAGYIGSCIDISDRKQAELCLQQRAEELSRSNQILGQTTAILQKRNEELDQFAYVASHDLKAPLRAIANLSEWLEEDLAEKLPAENQQQLHLLRGRVRRMESLINGLLEYSRIGRIETESSLVNVRSLLREVIESLQPPANFTIEVAPNMPTLLTKRLALQQVFANLIGNAIKHHPRSDGRVNISVQEQEKDYEFTITDDGSGIAPEYHEKIFAIFQTLESRDRKESTGIGLAIVKKIVETEGGQITLESRLNQGSTFRFTWPKQADE